MHNLFTVLAIPNFLDGLNISIDVTILLLQHNTGMFTCFNNMQRICEY
jgi:hypothetical protein